MAKLLDTCVINGKTYQAVKSEKNTCKGCVGRGSDRCASLPLGCSDEVSPFIWKPKITPQEAIYFKD